MQLVQHGKKCSYPSSLRQPQYVTVTIGFKCEKCDSIFKHQPNVVNLIKKHKGKEKEPFIFTYNICNKSFNLKYQLKQHQKCHATAKDRISKTCKTVFK